MGRASQQANPEPDAETILASGVTTEPTTEGPPAAFDPAQLQAMVAQQVATALAGALPAMMPELLKQFAPATPGLGPSPFVHLGPAADKAPVKPSYLKHYRRDDTISGKYQLIDVSKLDENGEIQVRQWLDQNGVNRSENVSAVKGRWIHFVNGHFYATDQMEVDYIEWRRKRDPQFRVYEDRGTGTLACGVVNCLASFSDEETLKEHRCATHGVCS